MKTLIYSHTKQFVTILEDGIIAEITIPELKDDKLTMRDLEEYFNKKFYGIELVEVSFKVCNDNFRNALDLTHYRNISPDQLYDHINMHYVSISKLKDVICEKYSKTGMYGAAYGMFKDITGINIDIEKYISEKDHDKETDKLKERIKLLESSITGALKCRDLWGVSDKVSVDESHKGEYLMLYAMEEEFKKLTNKK